MRQLYKYKVVQYFPYTKSDEFFNIGIYLYTQKKKELYLLTKEHFNLIDNCFFIKKNILEDFMNRLKQEKNIDSWYGNHLRLSQEKRVRKAKSFNDVLIELYNDKVGYKFNQKSSKIAILEKQVEELEDKHKEKDVLILGLYSVAMNNVLKTLKRNYK